MKYSRKKACAIFSYHKNIILLHNYKNSMVSMCSIIFQIFVTTLSGLQSDSNRSVKSEKYFFQIDKMAPSFFPSDVILIVMVTRCNIVSHLKKVQKKIPNYPIK